MIKSKFDRQKLIDIGFEPFAKLIEWSDEDVSILRQYGSWFAALESGEFEATTIRQIKFQRVAQGLEAPTTKYEIIWRRYKISIMQESSAKFEAYVDKVAEREIYNLRSRIFNLQQEIDQKSRKIDVLENQLSICHETIKKYETPPRVLIFDHVAEMDKHKAPRFAPQIVYASTDGQD